MPSVEERLQQLEDVEAIRRLKLRYARFCDAGYDAGGIASLFAEDGVWDGRPTFGKAEGRAKIERFFAGASEALTYARHYIVAPLIDVAADGRSATGSWYLIQPATLRGQPVWLAGSYDDAYVKREGEWLFRSVRVTFDFMTPYEAGWVEQQFVEFA